MLSMKPIHGPSWLIVTALYRNHSQDKIFQLTSSSAAKSVKQSQVKEHVRRDTRLFLRKGLTYCNHENLRHSRFKQRLGIKMRFTLPCYNCSDMDALLDTVEQNNPDCHSGGGEAPGSCCQVWSGTPRIFTSTAIQLLVWHHSAYLPLISLLS